MKSVSSYCVLWRVKLATDRVFAEIFAFLVDCSDEALEDIQSLSLQSYFTFENLKATR